MGRDVPSTERPAILFVKVEHFRLFYRNTAFKFEAVALPCVNQALLGLIAVTLQIVIIRLFLTGSIPVIPAYYCLLIDSGQDVAPRRDINANLIDTLRHCNHFTH